MIYGFRSAPTYRAALPGEMMKEALDMPMSRTSTFFDQAKGGILESFGLGTAVRDLSTPAGDEPDFSVESGIRTLLVAPYEAARRALNYFREDSPPLSEDAYKSSAWFREGVPWDQAMTEQRASALAESFDAKKVREFYALKRPITAFIGNLAGQATDPINYVPVAGPAVRAAAIARLGKVGGASVAASLDAAANTAIFGLATSRTRARLGDDVSWQATVSQIATAALIGAGFGAIGGALSKGGNVSRQAIEERLATLKTTQEARIALNEGIDALVHGEDVRLSPNAAEPLARVQNEIIAYHGSPHTFDRFDISKIGTGEGSESFGRGLYFAENEAVARSYQEGLRSAGQSSPVNVASKVMATSGEEVARGRLRQIFPEMDAASIDKAIEEAKSLPHANMYEVGIRASQDELFDWDKPVVEQGNAADALAGALTDPLAKEAFLRDALGGKNLKHMLQYYFPDSAVASDALRDAGFAGIKYLDQGSRDAGKGTRNFVIFDDGRVSIRARNGQPIDTTPARSEPPPLGLKEAESAVAKPDDYKALANQYRVDPDTGTFSEEADIAQLGIEGRLLEEDVATLADAQNTYDDGVAYGEALKSVASCLV